MRDGRATFVALLASGVIGPGVMAQPLVRLWPTSAANDTRWFTGVASLSYDGAVAAGWQGASAYGNQSAVWDTSAGPARATRLGRDGTIRDLSHAGDGAIGYPATQTTVSIPWRCLAGSCTDLVVPTTPPGFVISGLRSGSADLSVLLAFAYPSGGNGYLQWAAVDSEGLARVSTVRVINTTGTVSDDGSVAYFLGSSEGTTALWRWVLDGDSSPDAVAPADALDWVVGCSPDGAVAYLSSAQGLRRYVHGAGEQAMATTTGTFVRSISSDGTRAVACQLNSPYGATAYLWESASGFTPLSTLAPELAQCQSIVISGDGGTIAGQIHDSVKHWAFVMRLPAPRPGRGDYVADGSLDQADVGMLVACLAGEPNDSGLSLDFNADGAEDNGDVASLVDYVAGGIP